MSELVLLGNQFPGYFAVVVGGFGLLVGSFLNVVIARLPTMLEREWQTACREELKLENSATQETFNLMVPRSACPKCGHKIAAWENIPILSYLFLAGKCSGCKTPISLQYPTVEAVTGILSFTVAYHFGFTLQCAAALLLTWALLALAVIDLQTTLLPDDITLPFLWLGLLLSTGNIFVDAHTSIIGAAAGYLILWSVYKLFKAITRKEGMGYGDFKLLAVFGAWLGWQMLPLIILLSSLVGAIVGISLIVFRKHDRAQPIPFGPYLAAAGWIALLWGDAITNSYLQSFTG